MDNYTDYFYYIINPYLDIITNMFFGHNHEDFFETYRDITLFVAPAITPSGGDNNPSYRIYQYENGQVYNYDQYRTDILKSNREGELKWYLGYNAVKEYNIQNNNWTELGERILSNTTLSNLYQNNSCGGLPTCNNNPHELACKTINVFQNSINDCLH